MGIVQYFQLIVQLKLWVQRCWKFSAWMRQTTDRGGFNQADLMIKMASLMVYDGQFTKAMELLDKSEDHPSVTKEVEHPSKIG